MPRFIILGVAILYLFLPWFSPCDAMAFTVKKTVIQKGAPSKAPSKGVSSKASAKAAPSQAPSQAPSNATPVKTSAISSASVHRKVVNIVVDKIEDGAIYSRDGGKFEITSTTRVINNSHPVTKMRIAELALEDGTLVTVVLK